MPLRPHAHVLTVVRLLRSFGSVRRTPGRVPRQQQPDLIRLEYFNAIRREAVEPARAAFAGVRDEILQLLIAERREEGRQDASGSRSRRARELVDRAAAHAARLMTVGALQDIARKFGKRTSEHQRAQLDQQVRSAIGVPLSTVERPVRDLLDLFVKQNTELIKTVPDRYWDRIARDVQDAFERGTHPEVLAERFDEDYDISENDARRIARDQIGKLNGQLNQERQEALGVTSAIWRTMNDNRVRDEHAALEGRRFDWDEGIDGIFPGSEIQCRCWAEPDLSQILADL